MKDNLFSVANKVIIITGSSGGIGGAIANAYKQCGFYEI